MPDEQAIVDLLEQLVTEVAELRAQLDRPAQRYLGVDDAAAYSGLCSKSIRRLLSTGKLVSLRPIKGKILIDRMQLDGLIQSSTKRPRVGRGLNRGVA